MKPGRPWVKLETRGFVLVIFWDRKFPNVGVPDLGNLMEFPMVPFIVTPTG